MKPPSAGATGGKVYAILKKASEEYIVCFYNPAFLWRCQGMNSNWVAGKWSGWDGGERKQQAHGIIRIKKKKHPCHWWALFET
jgi:hypothetical protein